ncbi:unnamed protein product [Urochloa humidicola]
MASFAQVRFGGGDPPAGRKSRGTFSFTARGVRWLLYRKVVLSHSRRATMLILQHLQGDLGAPAFATAAECATWRVAPSRDGVEDAIYHNGEFYSITYSGVVEAWARHRAGSDEFTSRVVINASLVRPADNKDEERNYLYRKYLAAAPDGRLMALFRYKDRDIKNGDRTSFFKVYVLVGGDWKETAEIGDAAVFVGVNSSLCVSAREHRELRAGCVYFTEDDLLESSILSRRRRMKERERDVGVYSLQDGTVEPIEAVGPCWPPGAWFTPSFA